VGTQNTGSRLVVVVVVVVVVGGDDFKVEIKM
jgi:hypothetical protein